MAMKEYSNDILTQYLKSAVACLSNATGITGFVLNHNYTAIFEKVKPYLNVRNEIIEKYGEEADDGSFIMYLIHI